MARIGKDDLIEAISQGSALLSFAARDKRITMDELISGVGSLALDAIEAYLEAGPGRQGESAEDSQERGFQRATSAIKSATLDMLDERIDALTVVRDKIKEKNPHRAHRLTKRIEALHAKATRANVGVEE